MAEKGTAFRAMAVNPLPAGGATPDRPFQTNSQIGVIFDVNRVGCTRDSGSRIPVRKRQL